MLKYWLIILIALPWKLPARNISKDILCLAPIVTIAENQNNICFGTAVTIHATVINDGTNGVYNWKMNNLYVAASSIPDFNFAGFHDGDIVICEYTCHTSCGGDTTVISNGVTIHVFNDVIPLVTVSNDDPLICEGNLTTFTATSFYGTETPFYQWTVNDLPVGSNSPVYTTATITNGARIKCVLTISSPSCPGTSSSASSQLTIYVYPLIHPAIDIKPSKTDICRGETVTFIATANGGPSPSLAWEVNGVPNGVIAGSFITNTLQDGDIISCTVTVEQDSRCNTTTTVASNKVVIHVKDYADPSVTIAAPVLEACPGKSLTFTATSQNGGITEYYLWHVNGHNIYPSGQTFVYDKFVNGDKVSCTLFTDIPGCPLSANVLSNIKEVMIKDTPVIDFAPPEITIIAGEQAQLNALVTGRLAWHVWNPATSLINPQSLTPSTIPLLNDTLFNLAVANVEGCTASKDLPVKVLHKFYMPTAFTPNSDGLNDVFRIPAGSSLVLGSFSVFSRWGNLVFTTTNIKKGWDGKIFGEPADNGIYVYLVKGIFNNKEVVVKGTVSLLR